MKPLNFKYNPSSWQYNPMLQVKTSVNISPFSPAEWDNILNTGSDINNSQAIDNPEFWLNNGADILTYNSGRKALFACLKDLGLEKNDEVLIETTTGGSYISSCVTQTINQLCKWSRKPGDKTAAILIIHEFGFQYDFKKINQYKKKGIPIIEDCAYALGSKIEGDTIGKYGDYAVYSLTKHLPFPFGGILVSKTKLQDDLKKISLAKEDINLLRIAMNKSIPLQKKWNRQRISNWNFFAECLDKYKIKPFFKLTQKSIPGAFVLKLSTEINSRNLKKRLNEAKIESTEYYGLGGFYFPVHQFLTNYEKEYILYHFLTDIKPLKNII